MELSEAIRVGSKIHPQAYGALYDFIPNPAYHGQLGASHHIQVTCALGAAHVGANMPLLGHNLEQAFPILRKWVHSPCGDGLMSETMVSNVIMHLNDRHRWTREAIAMWIETLEKARDTEAAPVLAPAVPLLSYEPVTVA